MKIRKIILALVLVLALQRLSAQTDSSSGLEAATAPAPPDSIVQLTADYYGLPAWQSQLVPRTGTFWTLTPGSSRALPFPCPPPGWGTWPVYLLGNNIFLVDSTAGDSGANAALLAAQAKTVEQLIDQVNAANPPARQRARAMDKSGPEPDSGTGGLPEPDGQTDNPIAPVDYGTNLWLEITNISGVWVNLLLSNTVADVQYQILGLPALSQAEQSTNWISDGVVYGSETTNWTPASIAAFSPRTNLFLRALSWASEDGSGLPTWWELEYFGTTGLNPNAQDSAGDGWTIYQKFAMGVAPNVWVTPPAPQGMTVTFNTNNMATVSWLPSPGPVTSYTVTFYDGQTGATTTFTTNTTSFTENLSSDSAIASGGGYPQLTMEYSMLENYGSKGSSALGLASLEDTSSPVSPAFTGEKGNITLALMGLPADLSFINVFRYSVLGSVYGNNPDLNNGSFEIPVTNITNGIVQIPNSQVLPSGTYEFSVQTVRSNGIASDWSANSSGASYLPFIDERSQLKDNLRFLLRAASSVGPFRFNDCLGFGNSIYSSPATYIYSDYYSNIYDTGFDALNPIFNNYLFANFIFSEANFDADGSFDTGAFYGSAIDSATNSELYLSISPMYEYDSGNYVYATNRIALASLLSTNQAAWIMPPIQDAYLAVGERNYYGLPYIFAGQVENENNEIYLLAIAPGATNANADFVDTAQPIFQTNGYYFARPGTDPMPEQSGFSPANTTPLMIQGVGNSLTVAGYAKLAIQNSSSGVSCYLGQYFNQAYQINTNGNVTANPTGILSPYGNFFATQPGPAALVTMPDIDTGQQGTCTVYAVSLQVDKNHDTNMANLSFNSPDATSPASPMIFWANNNYDRNVLDPDDQTFYDDDVAANTYAAMSPGTPGVPTPDCNFLDGAGNRVIPTARDLQDFTRLWVCGITSNLLAALPAGSTITLNWGDVGSPNPGNPTIDLFQAADANGGIGYLTNYTTSLVQLIEPYVGRLGPGSNLVLNASTFANHWAGNHFIWCGVSNGTGGLNLTIKDGSGNTLAQTTSYIQIVDIKQMYERWTIGDTPSIPAYTNAVPASEDLPPYTQAFQYTQPQDTNTPYILFVHGWNMERWEKDRFAESAFKRLYWQGYHGRFGSFRWPTENGFTGKWYQFPLNPSIKDNFDRSEYTAWQSSVGLLNKLKDLNAEYPGHVYMLAHSMGNIVAGEALRLATQQGLGHLVNTYVASQAAVSAHTYDTNIANYSFNYPLVVSQATTPNIYGNWFLGNNGGGAGQVINFYNTNDFALQRSVWQLDQLLKPDQFVLLGGTHWDYSYLGMTNDPPPWNHFQKDASLQIWNEVNFDIVNVLTNRYEVMGLAAQPWTTAFGATPGVQNVLQDVDLTQFWPPDSVHPTHPFDEHFYHSAEFRGDYWQQQGYWNELLGPEVFNLK